MKARKPQKALEKKEARADDVTALRRASRLFLEGCCELLYECRLPGPPKSWARPQPIGIPLGKGKFRASMRNPPEVQEWEDRAAVKYKSARRSAEAIDEPVILLVEFGFSYSTVGAPGAFLCRASRPDFDNCCKIVCDALQSGQVIADDALFWMALVTKVVVPLTEEPYVEVKILRPHTRNPLSLAASRSALHQ